MRRKHFEQVGTLVGVTTAAEAAHFIAGTVFDAFVDHWPKYFRIGNSVRRSALINQIYKHGALQAGQFESLAGDDKARADYVNLAGKSIYKDISAGFEPDAQGIFPSDTTPLSDFCNVFYELDQLIMQCLTRDQLRQNENEFSERCLNDGVKDPMKLTVEVREIMRMDCRALHDKPSDATIIRLKETIVQMQHRIGVLREMGQDNFRKRRVEQVSPSMPWDTPPAKDYVQQQIDLLREALKGVVKLTQVGNLPHTLSDVTTQLQHAELLAEHIAKTAPAKHYNADKPIY